MDKRGQFFILGAIILALALFVLMVKLNTFDETFLIKDFYPLSENYKTESVKVVNDAIAQGGATNPNTALNDFTQKYLAYARTIDPNVGFVYVYWNKTSGEAQINNYLGNTPVNLYTYSPGQQKTDSLFGDTQNSISDVSLSVGGLEFKKTIPIYIKNFDNGANSAQISGKISLEIAGAFYDIPADTQFTVIARSSNGNEVGVCTGVTCT